jgi:ABC-type tungstate transport system substrate-binding protein
MNTVAGSLALATELFLRRDAALLQIVGLSLQVSGTACLVSVALGLWLGAAPAVCAFRARRSWSGC